ncbi:MAG: MFS transporter [Patescibacteria group bacterium]
MATSAESTERKVLWVVFAIVLVDMLGVGILIPVIPLLFADPAYPYHLPIDAHTGYLLLGALTALYPFAMFIATPILGQLSDTFGRKPILALSLLGTGIAYILFAIGILVRSIPLLFIARLIDGLTGGNTAVAQAAIADSTPASRRVRSFGLLGAANGIGFIIGPLLGAFLSDPHVAWFFGAPTPFWLAAGLSIINMLFVIFLLPETLKTKTKEYIRAWQGFQNIREALVSHGHRALYATAFLFQSGFAFIITFFGVYLVAKFNFEQGDIGYIFAFVGALLAITQVAVTGPLSKRFTPHAIAAGGLLIMSASLTGLYFVTDTIQLYILTVPVAICCGLIGANLTGLVSAGSDDDEQGSVLGINSSIQSLAQSIPPLFAGAVAAIFAPTTPILFAAGIIGIAGVFFITFHERGRVH